MTDVEDFISERISASDPAFDVDRAYRANQSWHRLCDELWPYVCLTAFLSRLYGRETEKEIVLLDATPEIKAAKASWIRVADEVDERRREFRERLDERYRKPWRRP